MGALGGRASGGTRSRARASRARASRAGRAGGLAGAEGQGGDWDRKSALTSDSAMVVVVVVPGQRHDLSHHARFRGAGATGSLSGTRKASWAMRHGNATSRRCTTFAEQGARHGGGMAWLLGAGEAGGATGCHGRKARFLTPRICVLRRACRVFDARPGVPGSALRALEAQASKSRGRQPP